MLISKTIGIGKTDKEDKALVEDKIDSEALLENFTNPKIETKQNALLFGLREDICLKLEILYYQQSQDCICVT